MKVRVVVAARLVAARTRRGLMLLMMIAVYAVQAALDTGVDVVEQ